MCRTDEELKEILTPEGLAPHMNCFSSSWLVITASLSTPVMFGLVANFKHQNNTIYNQERFKLLYRTGVMFDSEEWLEKIKWHSNNLTFEEAYLKTGTGLTFFILLLSLPLLIMYSLYKGRILNITVTSKVKHGPPLLLNYLTTPHVTIASAVVASAAVPTYVPNKPLIIVCVYT